MTEEGSDKRAGGEPDDRTGRGPLPAGKAKWATLAVPLAFLAWAIIDAIVD